MRVANPRSLVLFVAVTLGVIATPAIGQGLWSNGDTNGDRNGSNPSTGWVNVRQITSSQIAPALAASNEVHLVDVGGPFLFRDFAWSKTDGWKAPVLLALPVGGPEPGRAGPGLSIPTPPAGPGLAYRGSGIFDLVVRGSDQYYHAYLAPGAGWSTWEPIGGWGGDPVVTTIIVAGSAVVDVWVQAKGSIWRRRWKLPAWQAWEEIGRPSGQMLVTSPGVVVRPGGTIDIVAGAAGDGQLYHTFFSPEGQLFAWELIPGKSSFRPLGEGRGRPARLSLGVGRQCHSVGLERIRDVHQHCSGKPWSAIRDRPRGRPGRRRDYDCVGGPRQQAARAIVGRVRSGGPGCAA